MGGIEFIMNQGGESWRVLTLRLNQSLTKAWVNQFNTLAQLIEWLDRIDRLDWPRELPEPLLFKKKSEKTRRIVELKITQV